jgi:uncharacterized membrane protein YccC
MSTVSRYINFRPLDRPDATGEAKGPILRDTVSDQSSVLPSRHLADIAWQTIRLLAACAAAYAAALAAGLAETYWTIITAVVVTQPVWKDTVAASRSRIFGTLLGALVGFLVLAAARFGLPVVPLFWLGLVPLAAITAAYQNMRLSCITLAVIVLIPAAGPPFLRPLDRVFGILLGVAASLATAAVIRPAALRSLLSLRHTVPASDESHDT